MCLGVCFSCSNIDSAPTQVEASAEPKGMALKDYRMAMLAIGMNGYTLRERSLFPVPLDADAKYQLHYSPPFGRAGLTLELRQTHADTAKATAFFHSVLSDSLPTYHSFHEIETKGGFRLPGLVLIDSMQHRLDEPWEVQLLKSNTLNWGGPGWNDDIGIALSPDRHTVVSWMYDNH